MFEFVSGRKFFCYSFLLTLKTTLFAYFACFSSFYLPLVIYRLTHFWNNLSIISFFEKSSSSRYAYLQYKQKDYQNDGILFWSVSNLVTQIRHWKKREIKRIFSNLHCQVNVLIYIVITSLTSDRHFCTFSYLK